MSAAFTTGVFRGGKVELGQSPVWPDGTEVIVMPHVNAEQEGDMTQEEISAMLAAIDRMLPFDMSDEEYAAWAADRQARREVEKSEFEAHTKKLEGFWDEVSPIR